MNTKTRTKTYTNTKDRPMQLTEVARSKVTAQGIEVQYSDPLHAYPMKPGESITLNCPRGVRRVWREI